MLCFGKSRGQIPWGLRPLGFWPWNHPRHSIHHDTSSAFSNNVPLFIARCHLTSIVQCQVLHHFHYSVPGVTPYSLFSARCYLMLIVQCQVLHHLHCSVPGVTPCIVSSARFNLISSIHCQAFLHVPCSVPGVTPCPLSIV